MKNFIFAFILFALLTVNAAPFQLNKRYSIFLPCPFTTSDLLGVDIKPDPPVSEKSVSFNVSGTLSYYNITKGKTFLLIQYTNEAFGPFTDDYKQNFTKSIKAGTPFQIFAPEVPTPKLPNAYELLVAVAELSDDPAYKYNALACVFSSYNYS
ncbi:hypothetical protein F8M41_000721 [Gigaspora margarita]|uniref:Uncharacterized protein n=1 Tax=Gigaspora margarita TaxID=4874 RepID=A0A8H4A8N5_GIGMA|nr:hypothetical protein F8M41_000721 [Gigaspora margarita]